METNRLASRVTSNRRIPQNQCDMETLSRHPRSPPALMEELVEEILLRIPPAEPAHLFCAALVCKPWRRILSDPSFLRRYRALHRAPPLLGYFHKPCYHKKPAGLFPPFVSTTAAAPPLSPLLTLHNSELSWLPLVHDCHHGRVVIKDDTGGLIVWDPITGDQKKLSVPKCPHTYGTGAVLCTVDGCDHLDCHAGAFLVVYCWVKSLAYNQYKAWATMYSSTTGVWSSMISIDVDYYLEPRSALIIGNTLYFSLRNGISLLKYDLRGHELSTIDSPRGGRVVAMELDDGELGFVAVLDNCIYMWSWQADANNGIGRWEQHMVMELKALLLPRSNKLPEVIGLVEGTYTIFINDDAGIFALDIKSRKVKKVGKREAYFRILPYMSFYTPDLAKGILSPP